MLSPIHWKRESSSPFLLSTFQSAILPRIFLFLGSFSPDCITPVSTGCFPSVISIHLVFYFRRRAMSFSATGRLATGAVLWTKRTMSETVKSGSFNGPKRRMSEGEQEIQTINPFKLKTNHESLSACLLCECKDAT